MSTTIWLAIGALFFYGLNDLIYKCAAQAGVSAQHLLLVQGSFMIPLFVAYGISTNAIEFSVNGLWGSLAAIFSFIGFYNFAASMRSGRDRRAGCGSSGPGPAR